MKFKIGDTICFFCKTEKGKNYTIKEIFLSNYIFVDGNDFSLGTAYADKYYILVKCSNDILKDML